LNIREAVKKGHEKAVADQLMEVERIDAAFERAGDPNQKEPDVIYRIGAQTIGVEVATAYYDEADAQAEWEIATGEQPLAPDEIRATPTGIMGNPDHMICKAIQEELEDKCSKTYTGADEIWLCINMIAALSDGKSLAECVEDLEIPTEHNFARIYLTYTAPEHEGGKHTSVRVS
jgi:hypothetical protein